MLNNLEIFVFKSLYSQTDRFSIKCPDLKKKEYSVLYNGRCAPDHDNKPTLSDANFKGATTLWDASPTFEIQGTKAILVPQLFWLAAGFSARCANQSIEENLGRFLSQYVSAKRCKLVHWAELSACSVTFVLQAHLHEHQCNYISLTLTMNTFEQSFVYSLTLPRPICGLIVA
jgi:hypothetical protein